MAEVIGSTFTDEQEETEAYRPTKAERKIRRRIWDRYRAMADNQWRKDAEKDWEMGDKMFQQWMPERDEDDFRADIVLPDGFAAIQAEMQETIERASRPLLRRVEDSDKNIEAFANAILSYNMDRTGFDFQYFKAKYAAAIRGTAFLFNYYRVDKRTVNDPDSVNEDGEIVYKQRDLIDFDDDYTEFIENEYIFVDESASHIDNARDMVRREIIHIDEFNRVYGNKSDFKNTDKVLSGGDTGNKGFFRLPEDMDEEDVEILHYYNRATDRYDCLANNVVIREGYIPYKHKELPLAVVYHYQVPGQFWGMGVPKVIFSLTEERRSIRNLNLDRQKMQINKMFLVNDSISLDEEELYARPHGLIEVNTNGQPINTAVMPLEYGDVPASYFRTEEILLEDIRRAHGIDDRIQGVQTGGTATEAAILKESSQRRINMLAKLVEMDTMIRLGRLKWSDIQFFYPAPRIERITEDNQERQKKTYRNINVKGMDFTIVEDAEGQRSLKMNEIDGTSSFKLDKSMARYMEGDFDVVIDSEAHQVVSKPIQQAKITEMFGLLVANPALVGVLDPKKAVHRYLEINDEDPKAWMKGSGKNVDEMRMLAERENVVMMDGIVLPPTPDADEEHTLVHLNFANSREFDELPRAVQENIRMHIMGEHDANPNTGSLMDDLGGQEEQTAPGNQASQLPAPGGPPAAVQPADIQPSNTDGGMGAPTG